MIRARFHWRFHWRVVAVLLGVLLTVQLAVWAAVDVATRVSAVDEAENRLDVGARVLRQLLDARGRQLLDSVNVIAADFGFKQAVATRDTETIEGMLQNHGARVGARDVLLLDNAGTLIAGTHEVDAASDLALLRERIEQATQQQSAIEFVEFQGQPAQMALVPVRAPTRIGWVAMSFVLDDALLSRLREITGLDVSLLHEGRALSASTLPPAERAALADGRAAVTDDGRVHELELAGVEYLSQQVPLGPVRAVLQLDRAEVLRGFVPLRERLLVILVLGAVLGAIAATILARGVSRPVMKLAEQAEAIGRGDYLGAIDVSRRDELGQLAGALDRMRGDIAAREAQIAHQAYHDALTDLPNRAAARQRVDQLLGSTAHRAIAVLMLDLDRFKEINDTLGHSVGDRVLIEVARRIQTALRDQDLLARLGGDEFLVVIDDADSAAGRAVAERIVAALAQPLTVADMELYVDASIGVAACPQDHQTSEGLIRLADIAMYQAKQNRSRVAQFVAGTDVDHQDRLALVNDLRRAIPRGELRLHFQPKWDLTGDCATHAEALVRWQHPQRGLLAPDAFVPLAENSGRMRELSDWVLAEALRSVAGWREQGVDLGVAVNLSATDLIRAELPELVETLLVMHQVPASRLLLEITESTLMRDVGHALTVLTRLRAIGVELSIDDFGTGYSSLSQLSRLPVTEIKIDKSFVRTLALRADDVIVRSTIELGHNMGLRVVAEGVEDEVTRQSLRRLHCDQIQGYLIARPMPAAALPAWFAQTRVSS